jgi:pimeloyl-ACP methyl ester carboxylesterase
MLRAMIGHETVGTGAQRVMVLNDWLCDTSTWDAARQYLDRERFTWAFADLRGYGRSRGQIGRFDIGESASDVIALADALRWSRFAIVGHSMSSLVALHLAQHASDRVERAVALTPPPPKGFGADEARIAMSRSLALADDETRLKTLRAMWGERLSPTWIALKAKRWRETADPEAAAAYVAMFSRDGLPDPTRAIDVPVLAVTGEQDAEVMRRAAVEKLLAPICKRFTVESIADAGHYVMQEAPPRLVAIVERFLASA